MKAQSIGKNKKGFITLEILIAFAVVILCIGATVMIAFGNQSLSVDSEINNEAIFKAQALLEKARADSKSDFNLVNPVLPHADPNSIYTESLDVVQKDLFTKKVTSTISWQIAGRNLFTTLTTLLTNLQDDNTCSSVLSGDWTNPELLGNADVGQANGATDVDVFSGKAYVTTDPSTLSTADFHVIDVSDPSLASLPVLKSINTGPGLAAVQVSGQYAYVANTSSATGQLQVIDISNPSNPILKKTFKLSNVTGTGTYALGNAIFYSNHKIYLGLTKTTTGPEFNIIDVSNPLNPVWQGGYSIGHDVNAIFVRGDFAYIASPDNKELIVLNVSDPSAPILEGSLDLTDNSANGKSLAIVGNTLFLGRTKGASGSTKEFQLVDIADPSNPAGINQADVNSTINAIIVRGDLAFMVTNDPTIQFQIWDLNTMTLYGSKNIQPTSPGGLDCEGNYVYVAQQASIALQVIGPTP